VSASHRRLPSLLAVARIAARQAVASRTEVLGRLAFYGVLLLIFSQLWRVVPFGTSDPRAPVWYIAVTEWVLLSIPMVHLELERDFASGDVAYFLPQPVSYVSMKIAEGMGQFAVRLAIIGAFGLPAAYLFAGGLPADARGLPFALPLALLAGLLGVVVQTTIGVLAIWLSDVSPVYWIWQKCCFFLGGLVLPLDVYPAWLQAATRWTPFTALLYGPGRTALGYAPAALLESAATLVLWTLIALALLKAVVARGLRVLDVNGG
jgi:ABC-2 type transport system permease protein